MSASAAIQKSRGGDGGGFRIVCEKHVPEGLSKRIDQRDNEGDNAAGQLRRVQYAARPTNHNGGYELNVWLL